MEKVRVYDLLISCPSDVSQFVGDLEDVINRFNNIYGRANNIVLRTINWKKNAFSQLGDVPQDILNKQIVEKSDFAIAVFWTRFGTETENYGSGTEEEIEKMIEEGKQVFLYFLDKAIAPSEIDQGQYKKIRDFKEKYKEAGLFFIVKDERELFDLFYDQLKLYIDSAVVRKEEVRKRKGGKIVLWVDDCPENNVYARNILENYGMKFDLALSTERALNSMEKNSYDLIISDMGRREGSREGYVLLKKIRNKGNDTPFIIFSADGSRAEHRKEAEQKGAQGSTNITTELVNMVLKVLINGE